MNLLYQCDAVVYQWFSSNIFYSIFILQRLRGQSVLDLLLSALSSNPGGETGFDRLATGFHSAVPALTQALTDELHVLSRLAEPHTILGFPNTAYLSTITYELASQMERECETALRDNTTLSSKIKKYSARSRATVGKCLFWKKMKSTSYFTLPVHSVFLSLSSSVVSSSQNLLRCAL